MLTNACWHIYWQIYNTTTPFEGKLKNFEIRHHLGNLIASVNLEKATFQEAIEFKSMIDDEIDRGFYNIIISLNSCESFDSAFIGVLVVIWKKVQTKGGSLKLVKDGKFDHAVLHLTGAIEIFEKYDSIEEALESYSTPIEPLNASDFLKQSNFFKNN
jgi:anti-sigma B factor antagonist/stage II sporulation protein AA (anti-sigma F factor antagonist)